MPLPTNIAAFLNVLRKPVKTNDLPMLHTLALVAIDELKSKFLVNIPFDDQTLSFFKELKSDKFDINVEIFPNMCAFEVLFAHNSFPNSLLKTEIAIALLPDQLTPLRYGILADFNEEIFNKIYEQHSKKFTQEILSSIYKTGLLKRNFSLLNAKPLKELIEKSSAKQSILTLKYLTDIPNKPDVGQWLAVNGEISIAGQMFVYPANLTNVEKAINFNDANYLNLLTIFFIKLLRDKSSEPREIAMNQALNNLMIAAYFSYFTSNNGNTDQALIQEEKNKKYNHLLKSLRFIYVLLSQVENYISLRKSFIDFSEFFSHANMFIHIEERDLKKALGALNITTDMPLSIVNNLIKNYLNARSKLSEKFQFFNLLCTDQPLENYGNYFSIYAPFFTDQLYWFKPKILAELMHVANDFSLYLYDRVNPIASQVGIRKPEIVMNALRALKMWALHQDESLNKIANNHFLTQNRTNNRDISKVIFTYVTNSQSLINLILSSKAARENLLLKDSKDKDSVDVKNVWESHHQYFIHLRNSMSQTIANIEQLLSVMADYTKMSNSDKTMTTSSDMKVVEQLLENNKSYLHSLFKDYIDGHRILEKQYITSYLLKPEALDKFNNEPVTKNNLLGFQSFFQHKQDVMKLVNEQNQPSLKKIKKV